MSTENQPEVFETNLSEADKERLAILIEEAAEVQQIACKILRHGWGSYNPFDEKKTSNRRLLEKEIGDFWFAVELMIGYEDLNRPAINLFMEEKKKKIKEYLHFNIV
jgi:hypothetical protein